MKLLCFLGFTPRIKECINSELVFFEKGFEDMKALEEQDPKKKKNEE